MPRFISTRGAAPAVSFRQALFAGLAPDGGLYMPEALAPIDFEELRDATLTEVGAAIAGRFIGHELPRAQLEHLLRDALNFPMPLALVGEHAVVELFHGPTFAFKDIGARVMARLMAAFNQDLQDSRVVTILVATSGDTGGAVADAFHNLAGTRVVVLFPEGRVTPVQEAQFTTLGGNITAIAVDGSFDDCQRLTKEVFADAELGRRLRLTSANSINIGRLMPQAFPYTYAALQSPNPVTFSVPSGNFGNLTAGLIAWKLGVPIHRLIAATTINDSVPRYLHTGHYQPKPSVSTLANAMDVGAPSNFERMQWLCREDAGGLRSILTASVHTDDDVRRTIAEVFERYRYVCDPHTAIGYAALLVKATEDGPTAFLATAHPAKFKETVEPAIRAHVPLPTELAAALKRPRLVERIPASSDALRDLLTT